MPGTEWYPGEYAQPYYPRTIKVQDLAPLFLAGDRLDWWLRCRNAGLAMWKPGMSFRVSAPTKGYRPGFVTLDVTETQDGTAGQADFGRLPPDSTVPAPGVGWAHVDAGWFEQQYLSRVAGPLKHVIAHEVGHTLGFGHGGTGVMSPTHQNDVSDEEIGALRGYWHT